MISLNDALNTEKMPDEYNNYFSLERNLLRNKIADLSTVLDVGCGKVRSWRDLRDKDISYVGIDSNQEIISKSTRQHYPLDERHLKEIKKKKFRSAFVLHNSLYVGDAMKIDEYFDENSFDNSICLWNTLPIASSNEAGKSDEAGLLRKMAIVTKGDIIVTLAAKNKEAFKTRLLYYAQQDCHFTTEYDTQTIVSDLWGVSGAYIINDLEKMAKESKLTLSESGELSYLGIYGIFKR